MATYEKEKKQFTRDIPTFEQQIAAVWPKEEELKRLKAEAESLTRKIQLDIAQKQQEMQAKTADNGNGRGRQTVEGRAAFCGIREPRRTAGRTGARRASARIGLYPQSYSSRATRDEREGQGAEVIKKRGCLKFLLGSLVEFE